MVTAIALQEQRDIVSCTACSESFKPRAHRLTPARERAFKQRRREQEADQRATQSRQAEKLAEQTQARQVNVEDVADATSNTPQTKSISASETMADKVMQRLDASLGAKIELLGAHFGERLAETLEQVLSPRAIEPEQRAPVQQEKPFLNNPRIEEGNTTMKNDNDSGTGQAGQAINATELEKARHAIARQKLMLDYKKLQHESEKLAVERKKLELERVKLEILRKHNLLENGKLAPAQGVNPQGIAESKPLVEYDVRADYLPRTPTAIDRDPRRAEPRSVARRTAGQGSAEVKGDFRLELIPSEPKTLVRRNIGTKNNKLK